MKLVLLPGMDGTGKLFKAFATSLHNHEVQIVGYPDSGAQDYESLAQIVSVTLPREDYVLLAESFSGPLAARLVSMRDGHLKGIIFVASFLSTPNKLALQFVRHTPLKHLLKLPLSGFFLRYLMFGKTATDACLEEFEKIISDLSSDVIVARINAMLNVNGQSFVSDLPVIYLSGSDDKLVPKSKLDEFRSCFVNLKHVEIDGPHFLLQANSEAASKVVQEMISSVKLKKTNSANT